MTWIPAAERLLHNTTEIGAYFRNESAKEMKEVLVPDLFGNDLYHAESLSGFFFRIIYSIAEWVTHTDWRAKRFGEVLQKTQEQFAECVEGAQEAIEEYKKLIQKGVNDQSSSFTEWSIPTQQILIVHRTILPVLDGGLRSADEKIRKLAEQIFQKEEENREFNQKLEVLVQSSYLARLINEMGKAPPIPYLHKLSTGQKAERGTEDDLWIKELHQKTSEEFGRVAFKALLLLSNSLKTQQTKSKSAIFPRLVKGLDVSGESLFRRADVQHRAFQGSLIDHQELREHNGLGDLLLQNGTWAAFSMKDETRIALVFSNLFSALLQGTNLTGVGYGFPHVPVKKVHSEGLLLEIANPGNCLAGMEWNKEEVRKNGTEQNLIALGLANAIRYYITQGATPRELSPSDLWHSKTAGIQSISPLEPDSIFNLPMLEEFCWQISQQNLEVFRFIIHVSELNKHPHALFYQEIVKNYLPAADFEGVFSKVKLPLGMDAVQAKECAKKLWNSLGDKGKLLSPKQVAKSSSFNYEDVTDLQQKQGKSLNGEILKQYQMRGGITFLPPIPEGDPLKEMTEKEWKVFITQLKNLEKPKRK